MAYGIKKIRTDCNWLNHINGLKVNKAIEYLKTLQQDAFLNFYMEGDNSGCDVYSHLFVDVPMTFTEYKNNLLMRATNELNRLNDSKKFYEKDLISCSDNLKQQRLEQIINLKVKIEAQTKKIETINQRIE